MTFDVDRPYCLIHRDDTVFYTGGEIVHSRLLADVPRPGGYPVVSMVPYTQLRERGYLAHDGDEPIISLVPTEHRAVELSSFADPGAEVRIASGPTFRPGDDEFARRLSRVIADEIQRGEGSNFLISRRCDVAIADFSPRVAHAVFGRLARNEIGAYLTFCFFDGQRYFIGSSPERHLTYRAGTVTMNPICGTLPRDALRTRADLVEFLCDPKEVNELFQVVDEELKMMSRICREGGVVRGPYLKEMSSLIHTEYVLEGIATMPPIDAFRESMFAATMVGSPLENAARVIHRHESESRRYYSSALLIMGREPDGGPEYLDSAITIRTMEVDLAGNAVIRSGASIVRDSVPDKECHEVRAKAEGLLKAIASAENPGPFLHRYVDPLVTEILHGRNKYLSRFWIDRQAGRHAAPQLIGRTVLIIDNEDQFTEMLKHILEHLGLKVTLCDYRDAEIDLADHDLVLVGPGPGDPNDLDNAKMYRLHEIVRQLLDANVPFLAVCLGHQVLCRTLGLTVVPVDPPKQGVQESVDLFGRREPVGFYNTFFAQLPARAPAGVEIAAEPDGRVTALRADRFYSLQFHVESVLTTNCVTILREVLSWLLREQGC